MTRAGSRVFEALADRAQHASRGDELDVERRVTTQRKRARLGPPPVDLQRFAEHLGIHTIRRVPLATQGRLLAQGGQLVMDVRVTDSPFEQRYTIAHELSHVIIKPERLRLAAATGVVVRPETRHEFAELEDLCDVGAEEILLPRLWFEERLGNLDKASLEVAARIARESACDVDFVVRRAIDLGWRAWLVWWRSEIPGRVRAVPILTYRDKGAAFLAANCDRTPDLVTRALSSDGVHEGVLRLNMFENEVAYRAQVVAVSKDTALSLLLLQA
jgi:hypothetical protein